MRNDQLRATVQYQDYEGTVAADHHDRNYLHQLAKKHGVDTDQYFPFGVRINVGETRDDNEVGHASVDLLLAKGGSIGGVKQYAEEVGELQYHTHSIECSLEDILLYFKRFEVVLYSSVLENIRNFKDTTYE